MESWLILDPKLLVFFPKLVTAIAAGLSDNLQGKGPIPDKQKNQLLITGTAIGSFGFEFELPVLEDESLAPGLSSVEKALKLVQDLFQQAAEGSDDDIADLLMKFIHVLLKKLPNF